MSWRDLESATEIYQATLPTTAQTTNLELSTLQNRMASIGQFGIKSFNIEIYGTCLPGNSEYIIDVFNRRLSNIIIEKGGDKVVDLGYRNAAILQMQEDGVNTMIGGYHFTSGTLAYIRSTLRITTLDSAFHRSDSGVPARLYHDANLQLSWQTPTADECLTGSFSVWVEGTQRVENRKNFTMEYKNDKLQKSDPDLKMAKGRIYHRISLVNTPVRAGGGYGSGSAWGSSVFNVDADGIMVDRLNTAELQNWFCTTNNWIDPDAQHFNAQNFGDTMENLFLPLVWPLRDGFHTAKQSKGCSAQYNELNINVQRATTAPAYPVTVLYTYVPILTDQALAIRSAELGLQGRRGKVKTASKSATFEGVSTRVLPQKVETSK